MKYKGQNHETKLSKLLGWISGLRSPHTHKVTYDKLGVENCKTK